MRNLIHELSRRNVFRMAVLYGVASWIILSVADIVFGVMQVPEGALRIVFYTLLIGFPGAMWFSWYYELTPEGLKREIDILPDDSITSQTGRRLNLLVAFGVMLVLVGMALQNFISPPAQKETAFVPAPNTIAVLPFLDMSPDGDHEYFADGISEELLNLLARIPELRVAARTSAFAFKGNNEDMTEIARQLRVANVLEGSVRKAGNDVRITAQLIEADNGYHLFSETYDRPLVNIFEVQDAIAEEVVDKLKITLLGDATPRSRRTSTEAYKLYLQGMAYARLVSEGGIAQAIQVLEAALAIDPDFAPAWVELGYANILAARVSHDDDILQIARDHLQRALAIDETLSEAWAHLADIELQTLHYDEARRYLDKALALGGNSELAFRRAGSLALAEGRIDQFYEYSQKAVALDPLGLAANWNMGTAAYMTDKPEEALAYFDKVLVISPGFINTHWYRGLALIEMGDADGALVVFEAIEDEPRRLHGTALALYDLGRLAESTADIQTMEEKYLDKQWWTYAAAVRAHRGENDRAFELLDIARQNQHPSLLNVSQNPLMKNLHNDPRWPALIEQLRESGH